MSAFVEKTLAEQGFGACWARDVAPLVEAGTARHRRRTMFASLITGMAAGLGGVVVLFQMHVPDIGFLAQPLNQALVLALAALAAIGSWVAVMRDRPSYGGAVRAAVETHFASLFVSDDNKGFGQVILQDLVADGLLHDREYRLTAHYAGTYGACRIRMLEAEAKAARGHRHDRIDLLVFRVSLPFSLTSETRADSRIDMLKTAVAGRPEFAPYHIDHDQFDGIFGVAATDTTEVERIFTPGFVETLLRIQERLANPLTQGGGAQPRVAVQAAAGSLQMVIEAPSSGGHDTVVSPAAAEMLARALIMRFATAPALVDDLHGAPDIPPAFAPLPPLEDPLPSVAL